MKTARTYLLVYRHTHVFNISKNKIIPEIINNSFLKKKGIIKIIIPRITSVLKGVRDNIYTTVKYPSIHYHYL